jgi:hypothetical protein
MKYRLYVDEVGNSDMNASLNPVHQYLSLTGIVFELGYVEATVFPAVEGLKRTYFDSHPDDPIILHRKEIVHKNYPFAALRDEETRTAFDRDLLKLLNDLDCVVITVILDKMEYQQQYAHCDSILTVIVWRLCWSATSSGSTSRPRSAMLWSNRAAGQRIDD